MKLPLALILCAAVFPATAPAQLPSPLLQNALGRPAMLLNGDWHFVVDPYDVGISRHYYRNESPASSTAVVEYDFSASPTLHVPGDWNSQRRDLSLYEGVVWYEKSFHYHPQPNSHQFLYFGAANYRAQIWLNGKSLCEHEGGFTSFDCDATSLLRDGDNFVVVRVDDTRAANQIPALRFDWWNYGGLTRDVAIVEVPEIYVADYSLSLERGPGDTISGWVRIAGTTGPQQVTLTIPELSLKQQLTTGSDGSARFEVKAAGLVRWSPENPKLYRVEIAAGSDRVTDEIGFRTIEVRGTEILLNGRPVYLRGIDLHEEAPERAGRAHGDDDARVLLGWAHELGCNFVRLAHYPYDEHMVRVADRMGILVWSEIPLWQQIAWNEPAVLDLAKQQLREEVARDHNRSSIILWSVANETSRTPERNAFLHQLITEARALDSTRLITAATNQLGRPKPHDIVLDDPLIADLDVVGMNEYIGWYEGTASDLDDTAFSDPYGKPVIVSEFGAGAKQGLHGDQTQRWTEEYQANVYRHQISALRKLPFVRGICPWVLKDFRSPRRQLPGIQDGFNRKGLISDHGDKKAAFYVLRQFYEELAPKGAAER